MNDDQSIADAIEAEATNRALAAIQERDADHEQLHRILHGIGAPAAKTMARASARESVNDGESIGARDAGNDGESLDDGESIGDHVERYFLDGHTLDESIKKLQSLIRP